MLKLYSICESECHPDEATWQAWWAESQEDAERRYMESYEYPECVPGLKLRTYCTPIPDAAPIEPCREHRGEILRLAGWRMEGEWGCCCCGLAAMHIDQFALCPECDCCPECGHDDDCPNNTWEA